MLSPAQRILLVSGDQEWWLPLSRDNVLAYTESCFQLLLRYYDAVCLCGLSIALYSGGYCGGVPPLPIPNREVKPVCADGTAMQCGRVGGRHFSMGPDGSNIIRTLFFVCLPTCLILYFYGHFILYSDKNPYLCQKQSLRHAKIWWDFLLYWQHFWWLC